jgi:acyl-coenzyme A thioesterase PaaI-like protein
VKNGKLLVVGKAIRPGKSISYSEAMVFDENGDRIAHGTSTLMILPGKGLDIGVQKFL